MILKFTENIAAQRMDSLGPDFEEFFDLNQLDDDDETMESTPFDRRKSTGGPGTPADGDKQIDFYNRRPSQLTPNSNSR